MILKSQSTDHYTLLKKENLYYIKREKDKKVALIGDRDEAEEFILYGIEENLDELKNLNFNGTT